LNKKADKLYGGYVRRSGFCRYHGGLSPHRSRLPEGRIARVFAKGLAALSPYLFGLYISFLKKRGEARRREAPCLLPYKAVFSFSPDNRERTIDPFRLGAGERKLCAACGIFYFEKFGIEYLKIVGRGHPTEIKLADIRFVAALRKLLTGGPAGFDEFFRRARGLYRETYGAACKPAECYYSGFAEKRQAVPGKNN
jgi:hypothetical protein